MNNEFVRPIEILLKEKKEMIRGQVVRVVLFSRSKMIEIRTSLNESYFLIYYKNSFIYGELVKNVEKGSFIDKVCHEGFVVPSNHPFLKVLIPDETLMIPNKHKLFSHLPKRYSLQEVAYIATTLDSFFAKDQLIQVIDKIFFYYRRNGNFFKAFQIIHIIKDFAPELSLAGDSIHSHDFHTYDDFYNSSPLPIIYKKDPLFVELHCFKNRMNIDEFNPLEELLTNQGCFLELLLLWMEKVEKFHKASSIEKYSSLGLQFVKMEQWVLTLCYLNINPFREFSSTKTVMDKLISEGHYDRAASYLLNFIDDLPALYHDTLKEVWGNLDAEFIVTHLDAFIIGIQQLAQEEGQQQSEQKLSNLVMKLLETFELKMVHEKLQPIQRLFPQSLVIQKVQRMTNLVEDPDHMMELGQYYAEFKQYDEAIECFSWEMELHPAEPLPVRQLSKMYQSKGMVEEASAYQQVYNQLVRNQEIG